MRISVERVIVHPDYDKRRFLNDIAILKLSSSPPGAPNHHLHSNPLHLESFSSPNSQLTSSYSDNKNTFDISPSLFPSSSSAQSLAQLSSLSAFGSSSSDSSFSNLPLDKPSSSSADDTSNLMQMDSGTNSIWGENAAEDSDSFFKKKKSKTDWFFDSQIDEEMNNRLVDDNGRKKKNTVSEYFKIRARSSVENSQRQQNSINETTATETKAKQLNGKEQKFRNVHEFDVDAIKIPEYFMQFKGTATVVGWGLVSESDRVGTDHLMAANVRILENDQCKNYKNFEEDTQICAGYSNGGVDACAGDSGGRREPYSNA